MLISNSRSESLLSLATGARGQPVGGCCNLSAIGGKVAESQKLVRWTIISADIVQERRGPGGHTTM
jgi:hypothetical protein